MNHALAEVFKEDKARRNINFGIGDTIKVHYRILESGKERIQVYEGVVIAMHNKQNDRTMTVRRVSYDVGVERIFPIFSPRIAKIELTRKGRVRRAKLYFLRDRSGKSARIKEMRGGQAVIQTERKKQAEASKQAPAAPVEAPEAAA
jgi:large subunit ribosomal protein L19